MSILKWIQKHRPKRLSTRRKKAHGHAVGETQIKVGSQHMRLWAAIGRQKHMETIRIDVPVERGAMLVAA